MCCIFTCFGWILDLINRSITFTMSCTIVAAACCAFLVAGMAGIALGYNYSIHEYMDLRETGVQPHDHVLTKIRQNPDDPRRSGAKPSRGKKFKKETRVNINLRRGIFDDDLQQSVMQARRSGELPPPSIKDGELARPIAEEKDASEPPQVRRRLEDMVGEEPARYESSLKRLTGGPIASNPPPTVLADDLAPRPAQPAQDPMFQQQSQTDQRSIDRLKAIQSLINSKKESAIGRRFGADKLKNVYDTTPELDERLFPPDYLKDVPPSARKAVAEGRVVPLSPYRKAVPDYIDVNAWRRAAAAKGDIDPKRRDRYVDPLAGNAEDYSMSAMTYPPPVKLLLGPERPTRPVGPPSRTAGEPHNPYGRQWPPLTPPAEPSDPLNENQLLAKFDSRKQVLGEPQMNRKSRPADYYEDSGGSRGVPRGY